VNEGTEKLPSGWALATLGELMDRLQYGYTASADDNADGPRFLRITDLRDEGIDWAAVPRCTAREDEVAKFLLRDGDIVFARTGSIEKAAVVRDPPKAVFASYLIRGHPLTRSLSDWIGYFVRSTSYFEQIGDASAGIGRENVNAKKLSSVRIPVAPEDSVACSRR
jgi:type I restriction enzyme, S subunit